MGRSISVFIVFIVMVHVFCSHRPSDTLSQPTIFVSIPPQKYFVEQICDTRFIVKTLIPAGASPHTFEPKPSQMVELSKARLYFTVGVEMERAWLPRIRKLNPNLKIVASDSGISKLSMEKDGAMKKITTHAGHDHDHSNHECDAPRNQQHDEDNRVGLWDIAEHHSVTSNSSCKVPSASNNDTMSPMCHMASVNPQ